MDTLELESIKAILDNYPEEKKYKIVSKLLKELSDNSVDRIVVKSVFSKKTTDSSQLTSRIINLLITDTNIVLAALNRKFSLDNSHGELRKDNITLKLQHNHGKWVLYTRIYDTLFKVSIHDNLKSVKDEFKKYKALSWIYEL